MIFDSCHTESFQSAVFCMYLLICSRKPQLHARKFIVSLQDWLTRERKTTCIWKLLSENLQWDGWLFGDFFKILFWFSHLIYFDDGNFDPIPTMTSYLQSYLDTALPLPQIHELSPLRFTIQRTIFLSSTTNIQNHYHDPMTNWSVNIFSLSNRWTE